MDLRSPLLLATFGAALQELFHWYDVRHRLSEKKYSRIIRSPGYWVITILTIVASGFGTDLLFGTRIDVAKAPETFAILGAAFPLIFKKVVALKSAKAHLSADAASGGVWDAYFLKPGA